MLLNVLWLVLVNTVVSVYGQTYLSRDGNILLLNGEKVFMNGMNIAWHNFGYDFGNNRYWESTKVPLENYLTRVSRNGGNSIRIWLHCDGRSTPKYNSNGYCEGTDASNSMVSEMKAFLDKARSLNVLVFFVLWNGATSMRNELLNMMYDDGKLDAYINNGLLPMVRGLKSHRALGGWEIMNEPEGNLKRDQQDSNPCFDTRILSGSGAGWVGQGVPMRNLLRFINRQIAAIKREDPKVLITMGTWSERSSTDAFPGCRDYYTDSCLRAAGGQTAGIIDIYQMHTYTHGGKFASYSPFKQHNNNFKISKPHVIGEFSQKRSEMSMTEMYNHAYYEGYSGAWLWQANGSDDVCDDTATQDRGVAWLRGRNDQAKGGRVNINLN